MRALILLFFFVSGLCGLLYELVWTRVAGTVIGNTTYAIGTVVGVFMGGLALGAWWGGRAADRRQGASLLRLYGILECGVALSALAVPLLLLASEPLFRLLWNSFGEIAPLYSATRVLLIGVVLVVPTTLMGATLPVLSRFLSDSGEAAARQAGLAYAVNTFGGVAGTLLAGFWLVPRHGLRETTLVAVALNGAIGAATLFLARGRSGEVRPALVPEPPLRPLALWVAAISGFCSLVYEVTWTRSLVLSVGSTVYAFTLILTAFILGLAAGSAVSSRAVLRIARPEHALAAIQALIGVSALVLLPFLGDLPLRIAPIIEAHRADYSALLRGEAGVIALFILVPAALMGAVFPFAFRLASGSSSGVGRSVGAVYSWNTIGSIAGSLTASFLLVPNVGLSSSIRIAATVNLLLAAAVVFRGGAPKAAMLPAAATLAAWLLPSWDPKVLASGAYLYGDRAKQLHMDLRKFVETESKIVAQYWDAYGLTTVHESGKMGLSIRVNGKADASTSTEDMPTQRLVGHLGLLHHPEPHRVLVIGLGSGVTLGAVAEHSPEWIDCVELSPAGREAARHFDRANGSVLANRRIHLRIGDGRNAVQFAREPYDVIVSQPSNLWISGMANLFTREFFDTASRRLSSSGIFCQWVQAYRLPLEDFQLVLRTFFSVFPEGSLWEVFPGQDYILIGARHPIRLDAGRLERKLAIPSVQPDFASSEFAPVALLLGRWIADASTVLAATGSSPVMTDDLCPIEYTTFRAMFDRLQPRTLVWLDALRRRPMPIEVVSGADLARVAEARERRRKIASVLVYEAQRHAAHEVLEFFSETVGPLGDDPHVRDYFDSIANFARLDAQTLRLSRRFPLALRVLKSIPKDSKHYPDALYERAGVADLLGDLNEKGRCVRSLRTEYRHTFAGTSLVAQMAEEEKDTSSAAKLWREAITHRPDSEFAHARLAKLLAGLGQREEARDECRKALELDPENALAKQILSELGR